MLREEEDGDVGDELDARRGDLQLVQVEALARGLDREVPDRRVGDALQVEGDGDADAGTDLDEDDGHASPPEEAFGVMPSGGEHAAPFGQDGDFEEGEDDAVEDAEEEDVLMILVSFLVDIRQANSHKSWESYPLTAHSTGGQSIPGTR